MSQWKLCIAGDDRQETGRTIYLKDWERQEAPETQRLLSEGRRGHLWTKIWRQSLMLHVWRHLETQVLALGQSPSQTTQHVRIAAASPGYGTGNPCITPENGLTSASQTSPLFLGKFIDSQDLPQTPDWESPGVQPGSVFLQEPRWFVIKEVWKTKKEIIQNHICK